MRKCTCTLFVLSLLPTICAFAGWATVTSGTSNNLNGVFLLDSGVAVAVGDAGTVLKTADAGSTWQSLSSGTTKALHDVYFFDDNTGIAVGDGGLILRTIDGGATWITVSSPVKDTLWSVSFSGPNGISGGDSQDIIYSSDSGATWKVAQKGFFGGGFFGAHMVSSTLGFVAGQNSIFQPFVGSTTDGGAHWSFEDFYFDGNEGSSDDIFFFDANAGVVSGDVWDGTGAIASTGDGGTNWDTTLFQPAMHGVDFSDAAHGFAVGATGFILHSTDGGVTWSLQTSGTSADLFDVHFESNGATGLAVGALGAVLRTTDGGGGGSLELVSAASRIGPFEIDLPLTGSPGIECRSGGPNRKYTIVLTFNNTVTSIEGATSSCGGVAGAKVDGSDPHNVIVDLANAHCNGRYITVTVTGLHDDQGNTLASASIAAGMLVGDVTADGIVDRADLRQIRPDRGTRTNSGNFREDVTASGYINAADLNLVRTKFGTKLAP